MLVTHYSISPGGLRLTPSVLAIFKSPNGFDMNCITTLHEIVHLLPVQVNGFYGSQDHGVYFRSVLLHSGINTVSLLNIFRHLPRK